MTFTFVKYFTWGNIQPSRDFLDTLYIVYSTVSVYSKVLARQNSSGHFVSMSNSYAQYKGRGTEKRSIFIFKDLATAEQVFVRHDGPKAPL